jgi:putative ABC transport system permease protein
MIFGQWKRRLSVRRQADRQESDLEEEMRLHLDLRARQLAQQGMASGEAFDAARRKFGNRTILQEASRREWGWTMIDNLMEDIIHAGRMLRKTPVFTIVAVSTLALGIGMNSAVFSVVNAVMLRGLPLPESDRLVSLWEEQRADPSVLSSSGRPVGAGGSSRAAQRTTVSVANLTDYRKNTRSFEGLAGTDVTSMNLTGNGSPERITGMAVTADFFPILRVQPALGRAFLSEEDQPDHNGVVVISDELWQRRFGRDQKILGTSIHLDANPYRIIGVLPPEFQSPSQLGLPSRIEFYVPAAYSKELLSDEGRGDHEISVVGRLKPGATIHGAQAELDAVSAALAKQFPNSNRALVAEIAPLRDDIVREVSTSLLVLLGAVGLIVLVACLNVANLMLVRAIARRRETSVRIALGASRVRVIRGMLVESLLVALVGCTAGVLLGAALMKLLIGLAPASIPRIGSVSMDWRVLIASAAVALVSGAIFGILPAWQVSQTDPADSLRGSDKNLSGRSQLRWRGALTLAEIAVCTVLLIGAGLLLKSFVTVLGVDLGFQPQRVLAMNITLPDAKYATPLQRLQFFEQLETRAGAVPGILSVAFCNRLPLRGGWGTGVVVDTASEKYFDVDSQAVSTGYFQTLGMTLVQGRLLTSADRSGAPFVAVVNSAFVTKLLPNGQPIGHRLRRGTGTPWITIVGIVNDIRREGKASEMTPNIYIPAAQTELYPVHLADVAVRTATDPKRIAKDIQREVWAIDPDQPMTDVKTYDEMITASVAERRFQTLLLIVFAAVALGLALVGIYGVLSQSVSQRTAELGIRMALGAERRDIFRMILRQAASLILGGIALGVASSLALSQLVRSLLFGIAPYDWTSYAAAVLLLAVVGFLVSALPARRATSVDPMVALRYE